MLGEKIGEFTGRSTGMRVLPGDDFRYVKMEISWSAEGSMFGVPMQDSGTIVVFERVPGQMYGEGQGIAMGPQGGVIWRGQSIAHPTGEGMGLSARLAITFQAPTEGTLARLNSVVGVGEQEIDAQGNFKTTLWEWK